MREIAAMCLAAALAGCAGTPEPRIEYRTVEVPVPVKCAPSPAVEPPAFVNTDALILSETTLTGKAKRYVAGRLQDKAYEGELEAALLGCTG